MNPRRTGRFYYLKFMRLKGDPHSLALGFAIGVFLGILPAMPMQTILIIIATVITRSSSIAAILSSFLVCNPLTYVPQYYFSTMIGNALTPYDLTWARIKEVMELLMQYPGFVASLKLLGGLGYDAIIVLLVGGTVLALPFTIPSYFVALRFFVRIREQRRKKHLLT